MNNGPLHGIRVVELAGLGALPFATLKLADMGAEVIRIERLSEVPADPKAGPYSSWDRGRLSIAVDLKHPDGVATLKRLVVDADVFLEAFRPGVTERLGVGPDDLLDINPALVYGRLTGWGQSGPLAQSAGHSLNYEALTGVIRAIGPEGGPPVPLLQLLGDFAGGGLMMAYGVMCALWESRSSGAGQVIDIAMTDGVISLAAVFYGMQESGMHTPEMGTNLFDGGAPFYSVYPCSDGKYLSVAPIEPHFWAQMIELIGLADADLPGQYDRPQWPVLKARLAGVFASKPLPHWCDLLEGTDCCVAPVVTFDEARAHPHHVARETFVNGGTEVVPMPRLSRTPGAPGPSPSWAGADTDEILGARGFSASEITTLRESGAVGG